MHIFFFRNNQYEVQKHTFFFKNENNNHCGRKLAESASIRTTSCADVVVVAHSIRPSSETCELPLQGGLRIYARHERTFTLTSHLDFHLPVSVDLTRDPKTSVFSRTVNLRRLSFTQSAALHPAANYASSVSKPTDDYLIDVHPWVR